MLWNMQKVKRPVLSGPEWASWPLYITGSSKIKIDCGKFVNDVVVEVGEIKALTGSSPHRVRVLGDGESKVVMI